MGRKTNKVELNQQQLDDAIRLRSLILSYMEKNSIEENGLPTTQADFMAECGYTQGMFAQICGSDKSKPYRALTHEQAFKFARQLGVTIEKISPQIARELLDMCSLVNLHIDKKQKKQRGSSSDSA